MTGEVDVAVIGAGAAGIGAARRVRDAGLSFALIEARARLGGRAWTAPVAGFLQDLGCGWLHSGDRNPWVPIADALGFAVDRTPPPWRRRLASRDFPEREQDEFYDAFDRLEQRIETAGTAEPDRAAATLLEPGSRWNPLLHSLSSYINGIELDRVSIQDYAAYADSGVNWRVVEGYGATVAAWGADLGATLDCPASAIDRSGKRLVVATPRGDLQARAAIVTLPTALLAAEALRFVPALPAKVEAAAGLPLGVANKIVLALDRPEVVPKGGRVFGHVDRPTGTYHFRPFGRPLVEGYFGGTLAAELERAGPEAFAAFAIDELVHALGEEIRARLSPCVSTAWVADRFARGSYSHALPGKRAMRAVLAEPVEDRVFFAGEACSPYDFSTAHGALATGIDAAERAIAALAATAR